MLPWGMDMVTITATTSSTATLQSVLNRTRIEQARRQADQSEANARELRAQADQEERQAAQGQQQVRRLSSQRQDSTYDSAIRNASAEIPLENQDALERLYTITRNNFAREGNALKENENTPAVVNAQGQTTGRIVNLTT